MIINQSANILVSEKVKDDGFILLILNWFIYFDHKSKFLLKARNDVNLRK